MKTIAFLCFSICVSSSFSDEAASKPSKNAVIFGIPALDEVALIGLPKDEALKRLGEPEQILGPEEGLQTYDYSAGHQFSVVFQDGKLVQYMLRSSSKAKTAKGIQMGAHLAAVTAQYGDFTREEEVAEWFGGTDRRVLYHHPEFNKFKIIYPDADLFFMFDSERAVEVIWVGFPTQ